MHGYHLTDSAVMIAGIRYATNFLIYKIISIDSKHWKNS